MVHASVDPADPASVTRGELAVILLGMAGGLGSAAALEPELLWAVGAAAILVPIELAVSGHRPPRPHGRPLGAAFAIVRRGSGGHPWAIMTPPGRAVPRERSWR